MSRNPLYRLPLERYGKRDPNRCLACAQAGACRQWVAGMAADTDVPAQFIARLVLAGTVNADTETAEVETLWASAVAELHR